MPTAAALTALRTPPADGDAGDLAKAIRLVRKTAKRRGMVIVVRLPRRAGVGRSLRALTARHEVIAVQVNDRREFELPAVGLIAVIDPETGRRRLVDTADGGVRERYAALAARRQNALTARLASTGVDHLMLRTDRDWVLDVVRFVGQRRTRRRTASAAARPSSGPDHDRSRILAPARLVLALPIVLAVAYLVVQARRRRRAALHHAGPARRGRPRPPRLAASPALLWCWPAPSRQRSPWPGRRWPGLQRAAADRRARRRHVPVDAGDRRRPFATRHGKAAVGDFLDTVPDGVRSA